MKLFEEALSATSEAAAFRVLLSCDPSEYPKLREAVRCELERRMSEPQVEDRQSEEYLRQNFRYRVTKVTEIIAWDKKSVPHVNWDYLWDILTDEGIVDHYCKSPPPWLESALEFGKWDFLRGNAVRAHLIYITRSCLPLPAAGHNFYSYFLGVCHRFPEFSKERVLAYLRKYPIVVEQILPRALRRLAQKDSFGYLLFEEIEWWEDGRKLPPGETPQFLALRENRRPTGKYLSTPLARALRELAKNAEIDRFALPRTCLEAIADAPREIETRVLRRCHDFLVGEPAEATEFFDHYVSLLASPFAPVVKFAVDHLNSMLGEFTPKQISELLSEIPPALTHTKSKPLILETVRLIRKLVERQPSIYAAAVEQIVQALSLPAPDIQKEVLAVLGLGDEEEQKKVRASLDPFRTKITGSLKKSFEPWFVDMIKEAKPEVPPAVKVDSTGTPRGEAIVSLKSVDDMVFTANAMLSGSPDPMLLELFMAGLARLSTESRDSLAKALAPLHKRALKKIDPKESSDLPCWIERFGAELIVRCGPEPDAGRFRFITSSREAPEVMGFLILRLLEILDPTRPPRTLIGTPEFSLGFIRIGTLFTRTIEQLESVGAVDHHDFIQGIARVLSDAEALESAKPTDPEPLRVLHFLASGEILGKVETGVWWVTAARIRDPKKDYRHEAAFSPFADEERPDWLQPARYTEISRGNTYSFYFKHDLLDKPKNERKLPPNDALLSLRFGSIAMCRNNCDADIRWLFSAAPSHLEPILGQALALTQGASQLTAAPLKTAIPVIFGEMSRRQPPLGKAMRLHLLYNLTSSLAPCREATPELWLQAEVEGLLEPVVPDLAEYFRCALHTFALFDLLRVNPGLHAIKDLHPNLPIRLRDILLGAFSQGLESSPRAIGKTLELLFSLLVDYPTENAPDLSALAASPLGSKELGIVKKIIKALGR